MGKAFAAFTERGSFADAELLKDLIDGFGGGAAASAASMPACPAPMTAISYSPAG